MYYEVEKLFVEMDKAELQANPPKVAAPYGTPKPGDQKYIPKLDVLVQCAGVLVPGDLDSVHPTQHEICMDVNCRAAFQITCHFQDMLIRAAGCIVNLSGIRASKAQPGMISYCMAKAGLEMMTKSSALELARFGVRANCVSSSYLNTNLYRATGLSEAHIQSVA